MGKVFRENPIEVVAGIAGTAFMVFGLVISRQSDWIGLLGTFGSIAGASLAAIASASVFGAKRANDSLLSQLGILFNQLATSVGQITSALRAAEDGYDLVPTTMSRIDGAVGTLSTVTNDLGEIIGDTQLRVKGEAIVNTKRELVEIGASMEALKSHVVREVESVEAADQEERLAMLSRIDEMQDRMFALLGSLSEADSSPVRAFSEETVDCPACGHPTTFQIGDQAGDSSAPTCSACGKKFHAHQGPDGVFARRHGGRQRDAEVFRTQPRNPAAILNLHEMSLPPSETRQRYLEAIEKAHAEGRIDVAGDITQAIVETSVGPPLPSVVRMPLFYGLVNRDYGIIEIENNTIPLRYRSIVSFHECDDDSFVRHAEACWLAQAMYRMWGYSVPQSDINEHFFGNRDLDSDETALMDHARRLTLLALEHNEDTRSEPDTASDDANGGLPDEPDDSGGGTE